jgi:hypothetical protein
MSEETGLVVRQPAALQRDALETFGFAGGLARARAIAQELHGIVTEAGLSVSMGGGREHLRVEAWCACGALVGVTPRTAWCRPSDDVPGVPGYTARVEVVRLSDGAIIGAAEADCYADEVQRKKSDGRYWFRWIVNSPDYEEVPTALPSSYALNRHALKSMAQTRGTSKALAQVLRWIAVLGGYSGTPSEEMTGLEPEDERKHPESFEQGAAKARAAQEQRASRSDKGHAAGDVPVGAWYKRPPKPGPAPASQRVNEGKAKWAWALAYRRSEEIDVPAKQIVADLCQVLGIGELDQMHFGNFGDERKPQTHPNWVKAYIEGYPKPTPTMAGGAPTSEPAPVASPADESFEHGERGSVTSGDEAPPHDDGDAPNFDDDIPF